MSAESAADEHDCFSEWEVLGDIAEAQRDETEYSRSLDPSMKESVYQLLSPINWRIHDTGTKKHKFDAEQKHKNNKKTQMYERGRNL